MPKLSDRYRVHPPEPDLAEGFEAALDADPSDRTTRLVAADWLDEQGHPDSAEALRVQALLGKYPEDTRVMGDSHPLGRWCWWWNQPPVAHVVPETLHAAWKALGGDEHSSKYHPTRRAADRHWRVCYRAADEGVREALRRQAGLTTETTTCPPSSSEVAPSRTLGGEDRD